VEKRDERHGGAAGGRGWRGRERRGGLSALRLARRTPYGPWTSLVSTFAFVKTSSVLSSSFQNDTVLYSHHKISQDGIGHDQA
jgi:hypothetical protein